MAVLAHKPGLRSGRPVALGITIALHVALVAGLLAMKVAQVVKDDSQAIAVSFFEERKSEPVQKPLETKLEVPEATPLEQQVPDIPVEVAIPVAPPESMASSENSESTAISTDTPLRYRAVRSSDEYYPPQAIRMSQHGAVIVRTCVNANGRLSSTPTVVTSSQVPALDAAAVTYASEALRFTPATRGGVAVAACKDFRVNFTLRG